MDPANTTIGLKVAAKNLVKEMASAAGCSQQRYIEALVHYAYSIHRRPGSWEADRAFNIHTYLDPNSGADRWF